MRTRHFSIFLCASIMLLIAGCSEVPSEVQQEISVLDQQSKHAENEEPDMQYQTVQEIREDVQTLAARNTGIVRILNTPVIPDAAELPVYEISPVVLSEQETNTCFAQIKDALSDSLTADLPDAAWQHAASPVTQISVNTEDGQALQTDVSAHHWMYYADGLLALRPDETASLGITKYNAVCNFRQRTDPPVYETALPAVSTVPVGYDSSTLTERYVMQNGAEWSLGDAKAFAEDFYNRTFGGWCGEVSFTVKEIRVLKLPEDGFGYDITLQEIYAEKVPLLPLKSPNFRNKDREKILFGKVCTMWCTEPERVQSLSMQGMYHLRRTGEDTDKLISAESALNIVSQALAQKKTISVYMELGYAGVISGSEYMKITGDLDDVDFVLQNGDYTSCTAIPYWFFYEPTDQLRARMSGNYYLVNALTGELVIL